jgi:hypothetical protein
MEGAFYSALTNKRVDLPILDDEMDAVEQMIKTLPEQEYSAKMLDKMFFKSRSGSHKTS